MEQATSSVGAEIRGIEVLSFPSAELQKHKVGENKFLGVGVLSVLYFPDYQRFILYLNEWTYCLLKRLPVIATSQSYKAARSYILPAYNGYYILKLPKIEHPEAVENLETIFKNTSKFSYEGESHLRRGELSPHREQFADYEEETSGAFKERGVEPTGKLSGKQKIKRGFSKLASVFKGRSWDQKYNQNLTKVLDYNTLCRTGVDASLIHDIGRRDVIIALVIAC